MYCDNERFDWFRISVLSLAIRYKCNILYFLSIKHFKLLSSKLCESWLLDITSHIFIYFIDWKI